jgi:hypothetical protein
MVYIDMTDDGSKDLVHGVNLWHVSNCYAAVAKSSGESMLVVTLICGPSKIDDNIMLTGRGWYGIGRKKLFALGVAPDAAGELDPMTLIGRKVWVATFVETSFTDRRTNEVKECQPRLRVDIKQLACAGYQIESDVPPGATVPQEDDGPF